MHNHFPKRSVSSGAGASLCAYQGPPGGVARVGGGHPKCWAKQCPRDPWAEAGVRATPQQPTSLHRSWAFAPGSSEGSRALAPGGSEGRQALAMGCNEGSRALAREAVRAAGWAGERAASGCRDGVLSPLAQHAHSGLRAEAGQTTLLSGN